VLELGLAGDFVAREEGFKNCVRVREVLQCNHNRRRLHYVSDVVLINVCNDFDEDCLVLGSLCHLVDCGGQNVNCAIPDGWYFAKALGTVSHEDIVEEHWHNEDDEKELQH
jgi:hypothetical protein